MAAPVTALFRKRKPRQKRNRNGKKSDCRKWRRIGHFWPQRRVKFSCPQPPVRLGHPPRRRPPRRFTRRNQNQNRRPNPPRNRRQRRLRWRRLRQNRRPNQRRKNLTLTRQTPVPRKRKLRKRSQLRLNRPKKNRRKARRLKTAQVKEPHRGRAAVALVAARTTRSSVGTAACCMTASTANGPSLRRLQVPEEKIPSS